ncbi:serine/threonine-protein kinase pim-2-like isoform X2 [Gouania willdenowi]|uniref:serine/threonine-protein kinase pim-2-like isoform X2 n=1 Tax=Gouania willdenowi TaxID=441366 RepID=UPI001054E8C6|nr:serine/threonine-protein kinase pim-2-like isoform X2 [Gouania willdenowi]
MDFQRNISTHEQTGTTKKTKGPIPQHFKAPPSGTLEVATKDEDGLLRTGRRWKRKADKEDVLLSNSKKPKAEEGFQESQPKTTLKARRSLSLLATTKEAKILKNCEDTDSKNSLSDKFKSSPTTSHEDVEPMAPATPACIPSLESDPQVNSTPEDSPFILLEEAREKLKTWLPKRKDFEKLYEERGLICEGGYGRVYAGIRLFDNKNVAIKHVPRNKVKYRLVEGVCELAVFEVVLMMKAAGKLVRGGHHNPAIIELVDVFELRDEVLMIMELLNDTMDLVDYSTINDLTIQEHQVKDIINQIINAAVTMHRNGVFHRDIKADNILITSTNGTQTVKIIDFGCSDWVKDKPYYDYKGTFAFAPPEYFSCKKYHAEQTTVWQIGILLHNLYSDDIIDTFEFISEEQQTINHLSRLGKSFASQCLRMDPALRPRLEDLLKHPWFKV